MSKSGRPTRFKATVRQFHDSMLARVQDDGELSEPFEVTNGVKQGCGITPKLFSMMFSASLIDAFQDSDQVTLIAAYSTVYSPKQMPGNEM